jgi:N-acetylmuramate 1-kinase
VDSQWSHLQLNDFTLRPEFHMPGDKAPEWQALHGDAGFRSYYRLTSEPSLLAVYAPPVSENSENFVRIAQHLRRSGVLAPAIAACDLARGFMLIEDLGPTLLRAELNSHSVDTLYSEALKALLQMQLSPVDDLGLPAYSAQLLRNEMALFHQWFVPQLLGYTVTVAEMHMLEAWYAFLEESALAQPQVFVHRDFHSRNLIYRADGPPGVIDFQDAVVGPITYDLVSLLRDCYIQWPLDRVRKWALAYAKIAMKAHLMPAVADDQFNRWFDLMGLQRHIKVLGIFARLSLRDHKHGYLDDLPLVIDYTLSVARQYPQGEAFVRWFERALMPLIQEQTWYRPIP